MLSTLIMADENIKAREIKHAYSAKKRAFHTQVSCSLYTYRKLGGKGNFENIYTKLMGYKRMGSLLVFFSYSKSTNEKMHINTCIAFDLMSINMEDLQVFPRVLLVGLFIFSLFYRMTTVLLSCAWRSISEKCL